MPSHSPNRYVGRIHLDTADSNSVVRRGTLSTMSVGIQGLIRFIYSIVIGRWLGPALLASVNSSIAVAQIASLVWPTASGSAAVKFIARARGEGDIETAYASAAWLARGTAISGVAVALPAAAYSYLVANPGNAMAAVSTALLALALSAYNFVRGVYFAVGLVARVVFWDVSSFLVALLLLLSALALGWEDVLLLPLAIGYAVYAAAGWPRRPKGMARTPASATLRREMRSFVLWGSLSALATGGFIQLTMVIAEFTASAEEAGVYAAALSIATPASLLGAVLNLVLFPSMAHAAGRKDLASVSRQADVATRGLVTLLGAVFGALIIVAPTLMTVLYGPQFSAGTNVLRILLAACLLGTLNVGATSLLLASGARAVRLSATLNATAVFVGLVTMAALVPSLSTTGIAIGYLAGTAVSGLGPLVIVWAAKGMRWTSILVRSIVGAVIVSVVVAVGSTSDWPPITEIIAAIGFLLVWSALMWSELRMIASMRKSPAP